MQRQWYLTLAALFALACSDDPVTSDTPVDAQSDGRVETDLGTSADASTLCASDYACGTGKVCVSGACVVGDCNLDKRCPAGQECDPVSFTCSGSQACDGHAACNGDGYCVDGSCQDVDCAEDEHCNPGQRCNEQHRCVAAPQGCSDGDGDGYGVGCELGADCDDANANINPGVVEDGEHLCDDTIDQDCNGLDAICGEQDLDQDGYSNKEGDCDDTRQSINPGQPELPYNGFDDDCNPDTRDDDVDGDGFAGREGGGDDCDDRARHINPEARDIPGNGVDEDCDGSDAALTDDDLDQDGVSSADGDCDDTNAAVNPNADEIPYNGINDDCTETTPDNDIDGDGIGRPQDCDDGDRAVNPNAVEIPYNGKDDDCNPETSDTDADGDGVAGGPGGQDCNDQAPSVNPNATEVPYNGVDDDCDAATRDNDLDGDGFARGEDCNDEDSTVNPSVVENGATRCSDGVDHDCRGGDVTCDAESPDTDGDGVPDPQDCEPNNAAIPGAFEIPGNGLDDDCDPSTLDVPPACDDDLFDLTQSNATPQTATAVADGNTRGVQYGALLMCPGDVDFYRIDLNAGDGLEADLAFDHAVGDVDVTLWKLVGEELQYVDSSASIEDWETVYERRAGERSTYFIEVNLIGATPTPYQLTVNVFQSCTDDLVEATGEHNDSLAEPLSAMPAVGAARMICDYDDDWYWFDVATRQNVRLDLLFTHASGDLDMVLMRDDGTVIGRAVSVDDNELLEQNLERGRYYVQIFGVGSAKNRYLLFKSTGQTARVRTTFGDAVAIPDATAQGPGVARVQLNFDAPVGAIIRTLKLRDLDINHTFLNDLKVTLLWNDVPMVVIWDRNGQNGDDGGLDDDFLPFTGGDINFDDRLPEDIARRLGLPIWVPFAGQAARGRLTLLVEDYSAQDTGEIDNIDVEIEYLVP